MAECRCRSWLFGAGIVAAVAWPAYLLTVRSWQERWGATDEEIERAMPGDDLVPDARDVSTRAVTIRARPDEVWPWLMQMGYQRGGMYSYDWIDQLIGVLDEPSSDQVLPEFQNLEPGDAIPMGYGPSWPVAAVESYRFLVLDVKPPGVNISWCFRLYELDEEHTRLVLRIRIRVKPVAQLISSFPILDFGQFLMTRKMLLGIKERAETLARQRWQEPAERPI